MATLDSATKQVTNAHILGIDIWNLTVGIDHNPSPLAVAEIHLRIELTDDQLRRLERAIADARAKEDWQLTDAKAVMREALRATGRDNGPNIALVQSLLLPHGLSTRGTDHWNHLTGVDHNPSPHAVTDIHLRIELESEAVMHALDDAVTRARQTGDREMYEVKEILERELRRTGRYTEANASLVRGLQLPV